MIVLWKLTVTAKTVQFLRAHHCFLSLSIRGRAFCVRLSISGSKNHSLRLVSQWQRTPGVHIRSQRLRMGFHEISVE